MLGASFDLGDSHYHIWLHLDGPDRFSMKNNILFKNPSQSVRAERKPHEKLPTTKRLDAKAKANAVLVAELLRSVDLDAAVRDHEAAQAAERDERARQAQAQANREKLNNVAPALLSTARDLLTVLYSHGSELYESQTAKDLREIIDSLPVIPESVAA